MGKRKPPYPIGTRIRFIGSVRQDKGKTGVVVGIDNYDGAIIYLPLSINQVKSSTVHGGMASWICGWNEIEPIAQKGEQLMFSFMNE